MDLPAVSTLIRPTCRAQAHGPGLLVAGGTWVFSEPQLHQHTLIDLCALDWTPVTITTDGIEIAATATLAAISGYEYPAHWPGTDLFAEAAACLLASFKILGAATIGGNLALAYPAGAMIAAAVALSAQVLIWRADGSTDMIPADEFVTGSGTTVLRPGDVIRSVHVPSEALGTSTALRKAALADRARSAALLIGRTRASGEPRLVVTAATHRPYVLGRGTDWSRAGFAIPAEAFVDDVHGGADWRRAMAGVLAAEIAQELGWDQ